MMAALTSLLVVWCVASAEGPAPAEVARLVRQLDAPQAAQRAEAEQALRHLGPAVLNLLPESTADLSVEAAHRLARVRQQLEEDRAASTIQPSTVTLTTAASVEEILEAMARQTGNRLSFQEWTDSASRPAGGLPAEASQVGVGKRKQVIRVDFHQRPFWQALDEVLDRAGLALETYRGLRIVERAPDPLLREHVQYHGPFRLEPIEIYAREDLRREDSGQLMLTVRVAWEPRLRPISVVQKMAELQAVDESGRALRVTSPLATEDMLQGSNTVGASPILSFKLPPRSSQRIALLRGKFHFTLPGRREAFRFDALGPAQNVQHRIGAATVVLEGVRRVPLNTAAAELMGKARRERLGPGAPPVDRDPSAWQVRMHVQFDRPGKALESHRLWITENPGYLVDENGDRLAGFRVDATQQTEDTFGAAYLFDVQGPIDRYAFVYETPTAILEHVLDYQLKDISLP